MHRLLALLRRRIAVRIRGLRRGRLLPAVQVRNLLQICRRCGRDRRALRCLLLGFAWALFLRLLALRPLLRYVGCMRLPTFCLLLLGLLGDVILGRPVLGFTRRCALSMERRRLAQDAILRRLLLALWNRLGVQRLLLWMLHILRREAFLLALMGILGVACFLLALLRLLGLPLRLFALLGVVYLALRLFALLGILCLALLLLQLLRLLLAKLLQCMRLQRLRGLRPILL